MFTPNLYVTMTIVTSLSPNHSNAANQQSAIDSWQGMGECYSLNSIDEDVDGFFDIEVLSTNKTVHALFGKHCVNINAMIDLAISKHDDLLIINSDIILCDPVEFKPDGITMLSRYDYQDDPRESKIFAAGFDVFYIPYKFLSIFPPSVYAMGIAFWDYFIPYRAILANIPVYWPQGKHALHKLHNTQYSQAEWLYIGDYFKWEFKFDRNLNIGQMATKVLSKIQQRAIRW